MKNNKKLQLVGVFLLTLAVSMFFVVPAVRSRITKERVILEQLIADKSVEITETISRPINQLYTVASYVERHHGDFSDFDELANTIAADTYTRSLIIAPKGVVSLVYPDSEDTQSIVGLDYFDESAQGNQEAVLAMESREILLAGPYSTASGSQVISGFMPIYLSHENGEDEFWGFVCIALQYPEIFESADTDTLKEQGVTYELWRNNVGTGERQVILSNGSIKTQTGYLDQKLDIINTDWYLRVSPYYEWYHYTETWAYFAVAILLSVMITMLLQRNQALNSAKQKLEHGVRHDALTDLLNRQGLFAKMNELVQNKKHFQVFYMDINYFKHVNDKYGHAAGDFVLAEFARRIGKHLQDNQFFARMSGDEFVVVHVMKSSDPHESDAFWKKVDKEFEEVAISLDETKIYISFSRGKATYPIDSEVLDNVIFMADKQMYIEKAKQKAEMEKAEKTNG